jgi:hypothetical protein
MKKLIILAVAILIITSGASYGLIKTFSPSQVAATSGAATSSGFMAYPLPMRRYRELKDLVDQSSEIVVGVPFTKSSSRSAPGDRMIVTDYEVQVLQTIKGDRHRGRTIILRVPGGLMLSADGTIAEVRMPDYWKNPDVGKAYVFFLRKKKDSPSKLVGGPQGLFQITPWPDSFSLASPPDISTGRVIIPQVLDSDELMKNYNGKDVAVFLSEIKQMISPRIS